MSAEFDDMVESMKKYIKETPAEKKARWAGNSSAQAEEGAPGLANFDPSEQTVEPFSDRDIQGGLDRAYQQGQQDEIVASNQGEAGNRDEN